VANDKDKKDTATAKPKAKAARPQAKKAKRAGTGLSTPIWILIVVVALVAGTCCGYFVLHGALSDSLSGTVNGKTTISEGDLDSVMGTYTYEGQTKSVTARQVIELSSSLDSAKNEDGTYNVPASDGVISVARQDILMQICDQKGITVTDDEVSAYAEQYAGSSDYATIASNYGISEDAVKEQITGAAKLSKLRDSVVTTQVPTQPTAPSAPADGNSDTETQDYATYIINLAGDQWDSDAGAWKDSSSSYATALADYKITNTSASYAAAQAAYYVAYQQYQTDYQNYSKEWTNFVNGELSKVTVQLDTLGA